jgi:glucosamine--fructose-6-phosphate aminotransferase (isomerizing)
MSEIPTKMETILNSKLPTIKALAEKIYSSSDIFFIGRGADYYSALEASLKLKEISYIHSDAYAAGELKHGPIALIENDSYLIAIITNPFLKEKMLSNIKEVKARGAKIILIILDSLLQDIDDSIYDYLITLPDVSYIIAPILSIIPLQLLAYYTAKYKQLDVDKPRNLAKSVTVE